MKTDEIEGIEREIIEGFLILFRELYEKTDLANYFLELRAETSGINIAITNQRDALSHLVTVLNNPTWSLNKKREQLSNAEEHLRRAILEPYERSVTLLMERVLVEVEQWKVLGCASDGDEHLTLLSVRSELNEINELRKKGRSAKGENTVNANWERGVDFFTDAFDRLTVLDHKVEAANLAKKAQRPVGAAAWPWRAMIAGFVGAAELSPFLVETLRDS